MKRRLRAATVAFGITIAAAACGSDGPGVSASAARTLHGGVQLVRAAAAAHDRDAAASAIDHLQRTLVTMRDDGAVGADAQVRIRRAIERARANLSAIPTTTTTSTTTTTTTRPRDDERGHGHGRGEKHGRGHDD